MPTPSGWDYNLTKRCVKGVSPSQPNYFSDTAQCSGVPGLPGKSWSIAVQSENGETAAVCPIPENQSFLVNGAGSPVMLGVIPHIDEFGQENWSLNLKTNLYDISHPCGANHFTWAVFMDHISHGGGPFPKPDKTKFSATVNFNDYVPNGGVRSIAMYQGAWNGKAQLIEMIFHQNAVWGTNYPGNPVVFDIKETPSMRFLAIHGSYFGIDIPRLQDVVLTVEWHSIINALISYGYLQAPVGGWDTTAIGIGHEIHNGATSQSAIADLWFTNFRIESI